MSSSWAALPSAPWISPAGGMVQPLRQRESTPGESPAGPNLCGEYFWPPDTAGAGPQRESSMAFASPYARERLALQDRSALAAGDEWR
mmetsp:Transcript_30523/g.87177  ORF Transcript_30523/g.87177 Transcript_30523/m.87177 type:complete len:88 (+) Transcript_30523:3-266(+)